MASCRVNHVNRCIRSSPQTHDTARGDVLVYWNHFPGGSSEIPVELWASAHGTMFPTLARALGKEVAAGLKRCPARSRTGGGDGNGEIVRQEIPPAAEPEGASAALMSDDRWHVHQRRLTALELNYCACVFGPLRG